MSIRDCIDDGTLEWLIAENGYSLVRAPYGDGWRYRADVWNGPYGEEGKMWKCVPRVLSGRLTQSFVDAAINKLTSDYRSDPVGLARVALLGERMSALVDG